MQSARYVFGLHRKSLAWFLLSAVIAALVATSWENTARSQPANIPDVPLVFVARAHLSTRDPVFVNEVGPAGQFGSGLTKYAPGSRLVQRNPNGTVAIYNLPGLIDVQSPDINFAATHLVFAGAKTINSNHPDYGWRLYEVAVNDFDGVTLRQLTFSDRNFAIPNADQFGNQETYGRYHDLFPAYLADGRIAFVSSRYPTRANYDQRTTFNLYILDTNVETIRRVTTDRGGILHPTPLPDGRILITRWWNQFNQPSNSGVYNRIDNSDSGSLLPDGTYILPNPDMPFNPALAILPGGFQVREAPNSWHLMTVNPDGTDFQRLAWTPRYLHYLTDDSGHFDTYHATQPTIILQNGQPDNYLIAYTSQQNSTMSHTTLETGIRIAYPGLSLMYANATDAIAGLTYDKAWGQGDISGPYALRPWGLPDGRILYSQSSQDNSLPTSGSYEDNGQIFALQGSTLRYRLYAMETDGGGQTLIPIDLLSLGLGTADIMDAKPIVARPGWTALTDYFTMTAADAPALWNTPNSLPAYAFSSLGPDDIETSIIHNPNVYANPSLHAPFINNSPPPGSVAWAELWLDANQFTGAFCYPPGYPQSCDNFQQDTQLRAVLWDSAPVTLSGAFTMTAPADVMGFVILRDANGRLVRHWNRGYASIAQGSSWSRPGETVLCTGCHLGHVSGALDDVMEMAQAGWQNVAPYAAVTASSHYQTPQDFFTPSKINDRRGWLPVAADGPQTAPYYDYPYMVGYQDATSGWISDPAAGSPAGQWVELRWPAGQRVNQIRLVGPPRSGGDWGGFGSPEHFGEYVVAAATLRLYRHDELVETVAVGQILPLSEGGALIELSAPLEIDRLRLTIVQVSGRWHWNQVAALNEIEVVGQAAEAWPLFDSTQFATFLPFTRRN